MTARLAPVALQLPALPMWALEEETLSQTISYSYDGLYRLTAADYSSGQYFHYSYDAVGNRLSEETEAGTKAYVYDIANQLVEVDGVTYTWDDNGNLLSDGVSTYSYDGANRLSSVAQGSNTYGFSYNGLGDRLSQTVDGVTTSYTLDLNAGLTQVLSDGTSTYLYGNGRIAQEGTSTEYFLGDALGSVRQMADEAGAITLQKSYDPFGNMMASAGSGASAFAYTGEQTDASGLVNLRARYYAPYLNQFIQPDTIVPDPRIPADWNKYAYVRNNPINFVDPSGHISCSDSNDPVCIQRVLSLKQYGTTIRSAVRAGSLLPVEGFAQYVDYALPLFDNDIRGMMWALTITIDGFDANQGLLFTQLNNFNDTYWLGFDWLPYENNPAYNVPNWEDGRSWIHSRRGDWKKDYWDKTANQAFHFWFFAATTYFEGLGTARLGNFVHDNPNTWEDISALEDWEAPPVAGSTEQDWNLSNAGMHLGQKMAADRRAQIEIWQAGCESALLEAINHNFTNPGAWIRWNLKGPLAYTVPGGR